MYAEKVGHFDVFVWCYLPWLRFYLNYVITSF